MVIGCPRGPEAPPPRDDCARLKRHAALPVTHGGRRAGAYRGASLIDGISPDTIRANYEKSSFRLVCVNSAPPPHGWGNPRKYRHAPHSVDRDPQISHVALNALLSRLPRTDVLLDRAFGQSLGVRLPPLVNRRYGLERGVAKPKGPKGRSVALESIGAF